MANNDIEIRNIDGLGKIKIFKSNVKKVLKKGLFVLVISLMVLTLSSCGDDDMKKVSTNADVVYQNIDTTSKEMTLDGITLEEPVPNEDFSLEITYTPLLLENERWTVTANKKLNMSINTKGLSPDIEVYIDNVHLDLSLVSNYDSVNGITQDTMDDRIHNSVLMGIPISDNNKYNNVFLIEGSNQTFLSGSFLGFYGVVGGGISERRYVESDYLRFWVTDNKISSAIDLIIVKPDGTISYTCVSPEDVTIGVWQFIEYKDSNGNPKYKYYYFNGYDSWTHSDIMSLSSEYVSLETALDNIDTVKKRQRIPDKK